MVTDKGLNIQEMVMGKASYQLGKLPRYGAGEQGSDELAWQYGSLEERIDPTTIFGERMAIRHEAKKAYVYADSSEKIAKAMLRKTAPKLETIELEIW